VPPGSCDVWPPGRYPPRMTSEEPAATDPGALRARLGLPPVGVKLNREQSLRLLAALDTGREPIPPHVRAWSHQVLGLHARTA
jgi:hypothetical protein